MKIIVKNVHKKFNDQAVIKDISFELSQPGIYPLVGVSGSGKTTLLKITSGLLNPTQGEVFYDDINIFNLSFDERAIFRNSHIGFIFQDHYLEKHFTSLENILLPLYIHDKLSKKDKIAKAQDALTKVGLSHKSNQIAKTLSGGEAQRIAIARAIVNDPKVIFADEPTGNLDSENSEKIMTLLEEIAKSKIVILVTHNEQIARKYQKAIHIKDGRRVEYDR